MKFTPLPLTGAYLIQQERNYDERGYFARVFCQGEFANLGLATNLVQISTSFSQHKNQIRGMHYQEDPYSETKIIRCTKGAVCDVIVDLRKESKTYNQWHSVELSEDNGNILYVPKGFAHGYKTLIDNTELLYMMDQVYSPTHAREISHERFFS